MSSDRNQENVQAARKTLLISDRHRRRLSNLPISPGRSRHSSHNNAEPRGQLSSPTATRRRSLPPNRFPDVRPPGSAGPPASCRVRAAERYLRRPVNVHLGQPVWRPDLGGLTGPQAGREAGHTVGCPRVGADGEFAVAIAVEAIEEGVRLQLVWARPTETGSRRCCRPLGRSARAAVPASIRRRRIPLIAASSALPFPVR